MKNWAAQKRTNSLRVTESFEATEPRFALSFVSEYRQSSTLTSSTAIGGAVAGVADDLEISLFIAVLTNHTRYKCVIFNDIRIVYLRLLRVNRGVHLC